MNTTTTQRFQAARTNAHEALARAAKVLALCERIPHAANHDEVERTADFFEQVSDAQWAALARHAGVAPPSVKTRAAVCSVLRGRQPMPVMR